MEKTPNAKASTVSIAIEKELLMKDLIDDMGDAKILSSRDLDLIFKK